MEELQKLLHSVETFSGIQLVVTISVSRPFPRLNELLQLLRKRAGLVR